MGVKADVVDRHLERLDLYLAEFHNTARVSDALAVLECYAPLCEFVRFRVVDGFLAVKNHTKGVPLGDDFIDIPLAACRRHWIDCRHVDNRPGPLFRNGPRIPNIDLIRSFTGHVVWISATDEDATVSFGFNPELDAEIEVAVIAF